MFEPKEVRFALDAVRKASLLMRQAQKEMVTPALTKTDRSPVTVADGSEGGTTPLLAVMSGGDLTLSWDAETSGCTSGDYHLIWGWGADVASYQVSGADCTLDTSGSHVWMKYLNS